MDLLTSLKSAHRGLLQIKKDGRITSNIATRKRQERQRVDHTNRKKLCLDLSLLVRVSEILEGELQENAHRSCYRNQNSKKPPLMKYEPNHLMLTQKGWCLSKHQHDGRMAK